MLLEYPSIGRPYKESCGYCCSDFHSGFCGLPAPNKRVDIASKNKTFPDSSLVIYLILQGCECPDCDGGGVLLQADQYMLSRIDRQWKYVTFVNNIKYMPRGLSDHSPLVISLSQGEEFWKGKGNFSSYWLEIIGRKEGVSSSLEEFMRINAGTASTGVVWDTLKAYLRGILIQQIARVKRQVREQENLTGNKVTEAERQYVERTTSGAF